MKVKICGIRHIESADAAVHAGADFIGFNFILSSKRFINPIRAKTIFEQMKRKIPAVGIFQDTSLDDVNEHITFLKLHFVQLHGNEDEAYIKKIKADVIKVFRISNRPEDSFAPHVLMENILRFTKQDTVRYILLDRLIQGQGEGIPFEHAGAIARQFPTFLAGGLHVGNVKEAIEKTRPFAVDVAGGIEVHGIDDSVKIHEFIQKVKGVEI